MIVNLNSFLLALSTALDYAEEEIMHITTHHSKRCAYIALRLAKEMGMTEHERFDLCSLALMHDNGITQAFLKQSFLEAGSPKNLPLLENLKEHCSIGEKNVEHFPFLTQPKNVILYHHEYLDGTGLYAKKENEIPLMSQIICFADDLDMKFDLLNSSVEKLEELNNFAQQHKGTRFNVRIPDAFMELAKKISFWRDLRDEHIITAIQEYLPKCSLDIDPMELLSVSSVFSRIIDSKSNFTAKHSFDLRNKAYILCQYYDWDEVKSAKFQIAANLHDIGKLAIPCMLLEKNGPLNPQEFMTIKEHAMITHTILSSINGFEEIEEWASAHHERLDGSGYPFGLTEQKLSFESKLLASLDMYQALTETRPYRVAMEHKQAINIMKQYVLKKELDSNIVQTIDEVFRGDFDKRIA